MNRIKDLLVSQITWQKHSHERYSYYEDTGVVFLLRLNDFPDEPVFTVICGLEIVDIEDLPSKWKIPSLRNE